MHTIAFLEANEWLLKRTQALFQKEINEKKVIVKKTEIYSEEPVRQTISDSVFPEKEDLSLSRIPRVLKREAENLIRKGADAIIARGGIYQDLKDQKLNVPLIKLEISHSDILSALNQAAANGYKKVYLILHEKILFDPEVYKNLICIQVIRYSYRTLEELKNILEELEIDENTAIVGSGAIRNVKEPYNHQVINVQVQDITLMQTYQQTGNILKSMEQEQQKNNLLESIMSRVNEGVIIVDMNGHILHFNRKSEELLKVRQENACACQIRDLMPTYPLKAVQVMAADDVNNTVIPYNQKNLAVTTSVFSLDQHQKQLILTIQDVTKLQQFEQKVRNMLVKKGLNADYHFTDILTKDKGMKAVISQAERISDFDGSVLIFGDSGTGKELFAQSIHNASSRKNGPFVAVNCAAISENLLESELFGYVGGAFTGASKEGKAGLFEMAHKGTIFLDEINSMSLNLQSKILRVLERKEVMRVGSDYVIPLDVRIISASNQNLLEQVKEKEFRQDLYFRLNTFELHIPTLNERPSDVLYLFQHFLAEQEHCTPSEISLSPEFISLLETHNWWGNIRELKNTALRYHAFKGDNSRLEILRPQTETEPDLMTSDLKIDLKELNKTIETLVIQSMLNKNMAKNQIAQALGISRQALFKKLNP